MTRPAPPRTRPRARIVGVGAYLPRRVLTNHDLEQMVATSDRWIQERTGVRERRIAAVDEATSDLAVEAARAALTSAGIQADDTDLVLVATTTPDMYVPSTASLVQARLGANRAAACDLSAACSGFLYALSVADQFIRAGNMKTVLVIGAETMSRITDWQDRSTSVLFGDGAGAVVLRAESGRRGLLSTHLHADGELWDLLYVPGGGSRLPASQAVLDQRLAYIKMKGNETFRVAVRMLAEVALEALDRHGVEPAEVDLLIPHQANIRIIQAVADRLGLSPERVFMNLDRVGNTSAASIPLALEQALGLRRIAPGDLVLCTAFGAGLTWASALIRW